MVTSTFGILDSLHLRLSTEEGDEHVCGGGEGAIWAIGASTSSATDESAASIFVSSEFVEENSLLYEHGVSSSLSESNDLVDNGGGGGAGAFLRLPAKSRNLVTRSF